MNKNVKGCANGSQEISSGEPKQSEANAIELSVHYGENEPNKEFQTAATTKGKNEIELSIRFVSDEQQPFLEGQVFGNFIKSCQSFFEKYAADKPKE